MGVSFKTNPFERSDSYKFAHMMLYPKGTQIVYETLTPRKNSYFPWNDKMTVFGYELFFQELWRDFQFNFFDKPWQINRMELYRCYCFMD